MQSPDGAGNYLPASLQGLVGWIMGSIIPIKTMQYDPSLDIAPPGQLPQQPFTSMHLEEATRARTQEQLLEPELPPPTPSAGGVPIDSQVGKPQCRRPKHLLPCRGHKWETGTGRPENSLIPRPLSGNFLFPNMKKIKIGRQESQNMFAKPQSAFETPAPTISRLRIMAGVGNSGPVPECECTWTRARTMSVPHQMLWS